jgi:hypothetical protein
MPETRLNNSQLPSTLQSKIIDTSNDINTTTARLRITGGTNGQLLSTDGSGNLSWTSSGGGGAVTDGDKGDITVTGGGTVWTIDPGAVVEADIATNAVTTAKIADANVTPAKLSSAVNAPSVYIVKSANETVTSSTTFQDDDHLFTTLDANSLYYGELLLFITYSATGTIPGVRFGMSGNSLGTAKYSQSTNNFLMDGVTSIGNYVVQSWGVNVPQVLSIHFTIRTGSVPQEIKLRWSQATTSSIGIIVMKGSALRAWKTSSV